MKLRKKQDELYKAFYNSTIEDDVLDSKTELLVGLSAAISLNCAPCTAVYLKRCKAQGVTKSEIQSVLAKVMAVAAGRKRLQTQHVLEEYDIKFEEI